MSHPCVLVSSRNAGVCFRDWANPQLGVTLDLLSIKTLWNFPLGILDGDRNQHQSLLQITAVYHGYRQKPQEKVTHRCQV